MGWQPRAKKKRKCSRCGASFYMLELAGVPGLAGSSLSEATECPKCRKLRGNPLTRAARNQPPQTGK